MRTRTSTTRSVPAPVGGLNARDGIANMDDLDAVVMDNWFPETTSVDIRKGHESHATGLPDVVDTLMAYNDGTAMELYAVSGGGIYDVSSSGAVGAAEVSGLTNSRFQYITFGTASGFFLLAVNGADKLQYYTGSAWDTDGGGTYTITGVDTADCIGINNFKNRVWLIEKESMSAWYLPVNNIAGAASELNLSGLFKLGGYLVTMANWTIDNAAGIDDYAVFITSQGEAALYKGTNPASSSTWQLVGTFRIGKPIGRRCAIKAGADVLLLTEDGALPLSKALLTDRGQSNIAVTDKISDLFLQDARSYNTAFGWQPIIHPLGNKLVINIPTVEGSTSRQYVMNLISKAWCRFTGWNSFCYEVLGDDLYFGGNTAVYKADTGEDDNGSVIEADIQQSYSYFGDKGTQKRFTMCRPIFETSGSATPALRINTDYALKAPTGSPTYTASGGATWDVSAWDTTDWEAGESILKDWRSISGIGYSGGLRIKASVKNVTLRWQATDFVYERGGTL